VEKRPELARAVIARSEATKQSSLRALKEVSGLLRFARKDAATATGAPAPAERLGAYSPIQTEPAALEATQASMKAIPFTPSATVGNRTSASGFPPRRAARIARAASA
jgi:hypothetical protein